HNNELATRGDQVGLPLLVPFWGLRARPDQAVEVISYRLEYPVVTSRGCARSRWRRSTAASQRSARSRRRNSPNSSQRWSRVLWPWSLALRQFMRALIRGHAGVSAASVRPTLQPWGNFSSRRRCARRCARRPPRVVSSLSIELPRRKTRSPLSPLQAAERPA